MAFLKSLRLFWTFHLLVFIVADGIGGPRAHTLCQHLDDSTHIEVVRPNEADYEALRTENWAQTAWQMPTCIVRPRNTEHLQKVIPKLVASNVSFTVRSGGHCPHAGAGNLNNGILIDMSYFNHFTYDERRAVVEIGTGLRWGEVYAQLDKYQVTVVGGRVADVGVGGLTLGGGLSWLSDLYGLVADNVLNFEVVLANGAVINANLEHHPDLFWALKGGATNFGIVTKIRLKTFPIHQVWGGFRFHPISDLPLLMDAMFEYQSRSINDPYANMMIMASPTNDTVGVIVTLIYLQPKIQPDVFEPFYRVNSILDTTQLQTLTEFIISNPLPNSTTRFDWASTTLKPNKLLYQDLANISVRSTSIEQIHSVTAGTLLFGFQPICSSAVRAGHARGGNALGLESVDQTWVVIDAVWWWSDDDDTVHSAVQSVVTEIYDRSTERDLSLPFLFMNDANWDQDVIASYGRSSVEKLRSVQKIYDPSQIFQRLKSGYFKLP
ncbi:putative FAD-binding oxidoreductase [Xylaria bambusicola]|uniref:putative FAD-binding oxidoreductase n=1 Tax=Xylaria bambusicola TaxID=326684 RepID=UPI002008C979|nr:putative FAD-binding oxidoreductase [Xylaria bambusicola]KAI0508719.1 putative FAD-binding oxidoreductase [Xylaria bambusicola]